MALNADYMSFNPELFQMVYLSRITAIGLTQSSVLTDIMEVSHKNNSSNKITGVLCYGNSYFFQYIEGSEKSITDLKNILLVDRRHTEMKILDFSVIIERRFDRWSMESIMIDNASVHTINMREFPPFYPERWRGNEWQALIQKLQHYYSKIETNVQSEDWSLTPTKKSIVFYRVLRNHQGFINLEVIIASLLFLTIIVILSITID